MILQSTYTILDRSFLTVVMKDEMGRKITIKLRDWEEMGSPETVSVTILPPLLTTQPHD